MITKPYLPAGRLVRLKPILMGEFITPQKNSACSSVALPGASNRKVLRGCAVAPARSALLAFNDCSSAGGFFAISGIDDCSSACVLPCATYPKSRTAVACSADFTSGVISEEVEQVSATAGRVI